MRSKQKIGILIDDPEKYDKLIHFTLRKKEEPVRASAIEFAKIQPGEKVLDVGCGSGTLTVQIKKQYQDKVDVTGVDPSEPMVKYSKEKALQNGVVINFEARAIQELKFPDNTFDVAFLSLVIHHIPKDQRIAGIREVIRVLKPGGRLIIVEFKAPSSRFWRFFGFFLVGHMIFNKIEAFVEAIQEAGFQEYEIGKTPMDVFVNIKCIKPK